MLFSIASTLRREIDEPAKHRLVPRLPKQRSTQRKCTTSTTIPSGSKVLLCLSVAVAGPLGKPLSPAPSTQQPLSQLSSPLPIVACQHRFEPLLRGSTSLRPFATMCLAAAVAAASYWWYGVCFGCWLKRYTHVCWVSRSRYCCRYVLWVFHIRALSTLSTDDTPRLGPGLFWS